jgi:hypothetical protein
MLTRGRIYVLEDRYRTGKFICDWCGHKHHAKYHCLRLVENCIFKTYKTCMRCMEGA